MDEIVVLQYSGISLIFCKWKRTMAEKFKTKNIMLLGCLLSALFISGASAQTVKTIELKSAIDLALQKNENYQIALKEIERANAQITEAVSGALPQISGSVSYMRNWEVPSTVIQFGDQVQTLKIGATNNYTAGLTLTQPIYSGGRTGSALKIAGLAKHISREGLMQSRQELMVQVFNGFYGALLAEQVLRVNEEAQQLAQDNLDLVQKMYNQGMSAEFDLLRAKVAVANLQPVVIKARNDAEVAAAALKNLLSLPLETPIEIKAELDSTIFVLPPIDPEAAKNELIENRPEVKISDFSNNVYKQLISISKAGYRPSLYFSTSYQYQRQYESGNPFAHKWNRSIFSAFALDIPIFDSWRTPSQVKQARINYEDGLLHDQAVHKGMILDFQQSLGSYLEARKRLSTQGDAVELARRGLDIANVRFQNGVGTQLEVADARLSLSQAEINRAVAFHDLAVGYAVLLRSLGREINP
jgi:outer membrane protein